MKFKLSTAQIAAIKIAAIYAIVGFIWIAFSDRIASNLIQDRELLTVVNTIKGTLYVVVTAILLFFLTTGYMRDVEKAEEKYRSIFHNSNDAIFILDAKKDIIIEVNNCMLEMYGAAREQVVGRKLENFILDGGQKVSEALDLVMEKAPVIRSFAAKKYDSSIFFIDVDFVKVDYGNVERVIAFVRDVTERKNAENVMMNTMKELKRSNEDLEQFAMASSHDLKQPLRNISIYAEMLETKYKGRLDKDADGIIDIIKNGVKDMNDLIRDVLVFSRAGRFEKGVETVDTGEIVDEIARFVENDDKKCRLIYDRDKMPKVPGDRGAIKQIFSNLINNGIKFNNLQEPMIRINADKTEDGSFRFEIIDNGIGIDPVYSEKIFQIFERLHGQSEFPGTGIGLAICKKIVERHGGRIWVEPGIENRGSKFVFTLSGDPSFFATTINKVL
jgi:PAS domain S-box-containing protein